MLDKRDYSEKFLTAIEDLKEKCFDKNIAGVNHYKAAALYYYLEVKEPYPLWISKLLPIYEESTGYWIQDKKHYTKNLLLSEDTLRDIAIRCSAKIRLYFFKAIPDDVMDRGLQEMGFIIQPKPEEDDNDYDFTDLPF